MPVLTKASLVADAESLSVNTVFTVDRNDFATYPIQVGRSYRGFRIIG